MERFWIDSTGEGLLNIMLLLEGKAHPCDLCRFVNPSWPMPC
jgi:hypothetical protein